MQNLNYKFILFSVFTITFLLFLSRLLVIFDLNPDIGGIEENAIYYSLRLYNHLSVYTNPQHTPYINCQYTPFYFELLSKLAKLAHPADTNIIKFFYVAGRSVNLFANILSCVFVFLSIYKIRSDNMLLCITGGCIGFLIFTAHNYAVRPDSLKTFFVLLSFYYFICSVVASKKYYTLLSLLFAFIAVFVKQDAIVFLASLLLCNCLTLNKKWWLYLLAYFIVLIILSLILSVYYGQYFGINIFLGVGLKYSGIWALFGVYIPSLFRFSILIFGIIFCIKFLLNNNRNVYVPIVLVPLLIFPGVFLLSFKFGSAPVYFTDLLLIVLIIILSLMPVRIFASKKNILLITLSLFLFIYYDIKAGNIYCYKSSVQKELSDYDADCRNLVQIIAPNNEDISILTFDKNLSNHFFKQSLFPNYDTEFPQFLISTFTRGSIKTKAEDYFHVLPDQIFNYSEFHTEVQSGKVKYLILTSGQEKPQFLSETFDKFQIAFRTAHFDIYKFSE